MVKLIYIFVLLFTFTTHAQVQMVAHKAQKKIITRVIDVAQTNKAREIYELRGQEKNLPVIYTKNDSILVKITYPYIFGLDKQDQADSLNQDIKEAFMDIIADTASVEIHYQVFQQHKTQIALTKITLHKKSNHFEFKDYLIDLHKVTLEETPHSQMQEVFREEAIPQLMSLLGRQDLFMNKHNIHMVWGKKDCTFFFTEQHTIGFQKIKIPKNELKDFIKNEYQYLINK